jgi:hypothetical protein
MERNVSLTRKFTLPKKEKGLRLSEYRPPSKSKFLNGTGKPIKSLCLVLL